MSVSERPAARLSSPSLGFVNRLGGSAPATAVLVGVVAVLVPAQGGYFSTSWGWASTALALVLAIWAIASGRSEVARLELAFAGLLSVLVAWMGLSIAWSSVPAASVLEVERALVPLSAAAAFLVLARRVDLEWLTIAFVLAISGVALYALTTRLFPDRLGAFDPFAAYRLSEPIGYWNGLGIFSVVGLLAALAVVTGAGRRSARATGAAATVVLATTLYFTYSRASWIALALALAVTVAVSARRLATVAATALLALPIGLAVLAASRSSALTHRESLLPDAVDQGRRLAMIVAVLALAAAALALLLDVALRRLAGHPRGTRALGIAGWAVVSLAIVALVVRFGSPVDMAERSWRSFEESPAPTGTNLNDRLLSFSGNGRVDLWRAAWRVTEDHPVLGAGAGSFERFWQARENRTFKARDAHNLYVETLAELGPFGLAALVGALALPLGAGVAARRTPLAAGLVGAYTAFLVHAGVDWDWELSGVTTTALLAGCLLLLCARTRVSRLVATSWRAVVIAAALLVSVAGTIGLIGNSALAQGRQDIAHARPARAIDEADRARRVMPWSPEPWLVRGEAQLLAGDRAAAAASFRRAIEIDAGDWRGWHDLAVATSGRARERALDRARALYPRSTEIQRTIEILRSGA
jgi:hypothetical protein